MTERNNLPVVAVLALFGSQLVSCGGGVPVKVRIDEFTMEVGLDQAVDSLYGELVAQGLLNESTPAFPEIWPENLPDIRLHALVATDPVPVDLSPEAGGDGGEAEDGQEDANAGKYDEINKAKEAIKRIELNRMIMRVEQSTLTIGLPELRLQIADDKDASPEDRLAWWTIGILPATRPESFPTDIELEFVPGGESFLNAQLADEKKELAMRILGQLVVDTEKNPRRPGGIGIIRMIAVATFFVEPKDAL